MSLLGGESRSSSNSTNSLNLSFSPVISALTGYGGLNPTASGNYVTGSPTGTSSASGNDGGISASVPVGLPGGIGMSGGSSVGTNDGYLAAQAAQGYLNGLTGTSGYGYPGIIGAGQAYPTAGLTTTGNGLALSANSGLMFWLLLGGAAYLLLGSGGGKGK